jgi:hypothetical protein
MLKDWDEKIDISDLIDNYNDDKINVIAVAKGLADRLAACKWSKKDFIVDCIARLRDAVEDEDEFDELLEELYDWGDTNKRLWVQAM